MSPAPVRSCGLHGNAGTCASVAPKRTNAPLPASVTTAAGPRGPLGGGGDDAQAGAGRLADDDRVAGVDFRLVDLGLVEQAVAVVADAGGERPAAAELGAADDGIADRPAADQPRVAVVEL